MHGTDECAIIDFYDVEDMGISTFYIISYRKLPK